MHVKRFFKNVYSLLGLARVVRWLCLHHWKVNPRKVVFSNFWGRGFGDNPKYVALELLRRARGLELVWLCTHPDEVAKELPPGIVARKYKGFEGLREVATAAVKVDNQVNNLLFIGFEKKPRQYFIQTWHGSLGIKRIGFGFAEGTQDNTRRRNNRMKESSMLDLLVSNSRFETGVYAEQWPGAESKIRELGHPRNDVLVNGVSPERAQAWRERLGIPPRAKAMLYAPTFRDTDRSYDYSLDFEALLLAARARLGGDWVMVVRRHPRMPANALSGANAIDASSYPDMQELLAVTDALITDYSSCMFDFMLTRRPVFVYAPDRRAYETERGFYYPLSATPFPVAETDQDLARNITAFDETDYRAKVDAFLKEKGCMEDGHASERVCDLIEEFLKR